MRYNQETDEKEFGVAETTLKRLSEHCDLSVVATVALKTSNHTRSLQASILFSSQNCLGHRCAQELSLN